jgi:hypothetical protein
MRILFYGALGIVIAAGFLLVMGAPFPVGDGKLWHPDYGVYEQEVDSREMRPYQNLKPGQVVRVWKGR